MLIRWLDVDDKIVIFNTSAMAIIKCDGAVIRAHCAADLDSVTMARFDDSETAAKIMDQIVYAEMEKSPMVDVMVLQVLG